MNWPDIFAVIVVLAAAVYGLRKGFWAEILAILGVGLAVVIAAWLTPVLMPLLPSMGVWMMNALSVVVFLAVAAISLGLWGALSRKTLGWVPEPLAPLNRLGGVAVGAAKGMALAGLVFFALIQPAAPAQWHDAARKASFAPLTLSLDVLALDRLSRPLPVFRPLSRILGYALLKHQQTPGAPAVVLGKVSATHPNA